MTVVSSPIFFKHCVSLQSSVLNNSCAVSRLFLQMNNCTIHRKNIHNYCQTDQVHFTLKNNFKNIIVFLFWELISFLGSWINIKANKLTFPEQRLILKLQNLEIHSLRKYFSIELYTCI